MAGGEMFYIYMMKTMFNPLVKFDVRMIDALREKGERYLVSQQYLYGGQQREKNGRTNLLLTRYRDKATAVIHKDAVNNDKLAAIVDLELAGHRERLVKLLSPDSVYNVFIDITSDLKKMEAEANKLYAEDLKRYIRSRTTWDLERGASLQPRLKLIYGEWFVYLQYNGKTLQVSLEDIVNC